ncbi:serine/threonine-protein kinase [Polyangium sp. 6x1]|uniref:serine/threonine-protein kinase n=1 Tax=Polyangium sp. 6x1 TaxID=3042689 RepID=UPI0024823504|nr:serine/threonine-protein kinase [Polyangium sp. 6x1]MDI1449997.1 serine/threonine-protein kinase [Polyangium sp. 6x1]
MAPGPSPSLPDDGKVCPTCGRGYPLQYNICPQDGATLALKDELVGTTLRDTFRLVRVLGEGGMGRVYEAEHVRIASKRFAIKMLHPEFARQPQILARFLREAEATAAIDSPHVLEVYDVDRTPDGRPYIVGELLQGRELAAHLRQSGKMQIGPAVRIVRQICKALAAAHARGIVHRDMKPENVFLTGDLQRPTIKILDFGISKVESGTGPALTRTGMIMGTPSYMSPEQAKGQKIDHRTDIYAVGAILYALLTGRKPFDGEDPTAIMARVLREDPPPPRAVEPTISGAVEDIIQKAMAKDPQHRPASVKELDEALAPFDPGDPDPNEGAAAKPGGDPPRRRANAILSDRTQLLVTVATGLGCAAAMLVVGLAAIFRFARSSSPNSNITGGEAVLLILIVGALVFGPAWFLGRRPFQAISSDDAKVSEVLAWLLPIVAFGIGIYGVSSLLVRFFETILLQHALGVAWAPWDILLLAAGFGAAIAAFKLNSSR